jgi:transposase
MVEAYESGKSGTYRETAEVFGVGEASVSRHLARFRATGDVLDAPRSANNPRRVDLSWLAANAEADPDAPLRERVEAWEVHSGVRVGLTTMWKALRAIGWTHKKRHLWRASGNGRTS